MEDYGYVSIDLLNNEKLFFHGILEKICKSDNFYCSSKKKYICGDVTSKAHVTIFYGIKNSLENQDIIKNIINNVDIKTIEIGEVFILKSKGNEYNILCINVIDEDSRLIKLANNLKITDHEKSVQFPFKPHISIAYVKKSYILDTRYCINKVIPIREIKYYDK